MKLRKQYSCKYQVVELEEELAEGVDELVVGAKMDVVAKELLDNMVAVVNELDKKYSAPAPQTTTQVRTPNGSVSEKQVKVITNNIKRAVGIASNLGIQLNGVADINNLTGKQASDIINELFKSNNKQQVGF